MKKCEAGEKKPLPVLVVSRFSPFLCTFYFALFASLLRPLRPRGVGLSNKQGRVNAYLDPQFQQLNLPAKISRKIRVSSASK